MVDFLLYLSRFLYQSGGGSTLPFHLASASLHATATALMAVMVLSVAKKTEN